MLIRTGNAGTQVRQLQQELKAAGCSPGPVDGIFGPKTLAAVKAYQAKNHLAVDGLVGPKTWKALTTDAFDPAKPGGTDAPATPPATEPTGQASSPQVQKLLDEARSHLGFHEGAGNNNPFSHELGRPSEAWCADFVSYCAKKAGLHVNTASAQGVANALQAHGTWKGRSNPQPGDAVTFRWDGTHGWADHVGLVEKVFQKDGKTYIQTIEGNSSDKVQRKVYPADSAVINGYGSLY